MTPKCGACGPWKTQPDRVSEETLASGSGGRRAAAGQNAHRKGLQPQVAVGEPGLGGGEGPSSVSEAPSPLTQISAPAEEPAATGYSPRDGEESRPGRGHRADSAGGAGRVCAQAVREGVSLLHSNRPGQTPWGQGHNNLSVNRPGDAKIHFCPKSGKARPCPRPSGLTEGWASTSAHPAGASMSGRLEDMVTGRGILLKTK